MISQESCVRLRKGEILKSVEEDRFASPFVIKAFRFGEQSKQRYLGVVVDL